MPRDYRFLKHEKDPIIDLIRTAFLDSNQTVEQIAERSTITKSTIYNWLYGDVSRPQRYTTQRVLEALGIEIKYLKGGKEFEIRPGVAHKFSKRPKLKVLRGRKGK